MTNLSQTKLRVCETFSSIQGEGTHVGVPCFFIRLTGCNLRCNYCDTTYAYDSGTTTSVEELVNEWRSSRLPYVLITGGEPLLQPGVYPLMNTLLAHGAKCLLETNGSVSIAQVPRGVCKIVDWKTPGSGSGGSFFVENLRYLSRSDELKFVLTSRADYEWVRDLILAKGLNNLCPVLLSPCYGAVNPSELALWILTDKLDVRLQLQLHKVIWGEKMGV
ncbi:MAG: radical SAM protein [Thermodesulfobacteria bacterium]|nr:radical SAM protein [Thermodesulfobacteriota bacterium]